MIHISKQAIVWSLALTGAVLVVPLIAMQFTDQVSWKTGDFVVAAAMVLVASLMYFHITQRQRKQTNKLLWGLLIGLLLISVWVVLAIDII